MADELCTPIETNDVQEYVRGNIGTFHCSRLESLRKLKLGAILKRKNPYLFRAKNILLAQDLVRTILDAHLSSQEEALFGTFLEGLAIHINQRICGGRKSAAEGVDIEFDRDGIRYVVAIKSGPNWGNSGQIRKMKEDFTRAGRILRTSNSKLQIVAVNGCCYGRDNRPDKGEYYKYCGQRFWEFISADADLYLRIVKPLAHEAKERNTEFLEAYAQIVNQFTVELSERFVANGMLVWDALVKFNSAAASELKPKRAGAHRHPRAPDAL